MNDGIYQVLALGIGAVAVYTDTRHGLIPNRLTFPALGLGLAVHGALAGWPGLGIAASGAALGLGLLVVPYLVGGMGGGDVKLLAALGSLLGPASIFSIFAFSTLVGAALGLVVLMRVHGRYGFLGLLAGWKGLFSPHMRTRMTAFPFASAIFAGLLASLLLGGARGA